MGPSDRSLQDSQRCAQGRLGHDSAARLFAVATTGMNSPSRSRIATSGSGHRDLRGHRADDGPASCSVPVGHHQGGGGRTAQRAPALRPPRRLLFVVAFHIGSITCSTGTGSEIDSSARSLGSKGDCINATRPRAPVGCGTTAGIRALPPPLCSESPGSDARRQKPWTRRSL